MSRMLIAILLLFASCAMIAQGVLAYELNISRNLIAEEETHDHSEKSNKESKEKFVSAFAIDHYSLGHSSSDNNILNDLRNYKGFAQKPYLPPEVI